MQNEILFVICNFCNGRGFTTGRVGPLICLKCYGEKYIPKDESLIPLLKQYKQK